MRAYVVEGDQNASATAAAAGIVKIEGAASNPQRLFLYEWNIGNEGATPADVNMTIRIKRQTTAGTWTNPTPTANDPADGASTAVGGSNSTAAGSAGASLGQFGINQRAGFRWVAVPGGGELVNPATAANGIIMEFSQVSSGTDLMIGTFHFWE